jgi:hypothetical protein
MKVVWIAGLALAAAANAHAQTTIYKHVDESGRVTYSNKPMKGATVLELEPLTVIQSGPAVVAGPKPTAAMVDKSETSTARADAKPAVATLTAAPTLAAIDPQVQRRRDGDRRRILEDELQREEQSLSTARDSLTLEQRNPTLVAAVRNAQQAVDPSPAQLADLRNTIDKASGRIRGLQATVAEHEKNIEALKTELGALKP